jgi:GT2 family glycosyltransferase
LDGSLIEKDGLVQMQGIPAGFMLLKRSMIEKMYEHYKDLSYDPIVPGDISGVALFNSDVVNRKFYGEDILFCKRAIDAGFEIWTDPNVALSHAGAKAYLRDALKNMVGKDGQKN